MKIPNQLAKILGNKYVLYFILILTIINLGGYLLVGDITAVSLFILLGIIMTFFSKNMIIILSVPLILTSVLLVGNKIHEGLENNKKKKHHNKEKNTKTNDDDHLMTGPLDPAPNAMTLYKKNNRVDYASTLEDAYGDLNNLLGSDGIKNLTSDTQKLMDQQLQLADALKGMTPLIGQAKSMLQGLDLKGLTSITQKLSPSN
jgi:hypothetical protein